MDKRLYILAEFDGAAQEKIRDLAKLLRENNLEGTQTKDIPYHITLGSYAANIENDLMILLDEIEKNITAFDVSFGSLGLFGLKVLFLNPDMSLELIELYNYIKGKSPHEGDNLSAHATLLIDEPESILKALPLLAGKFRAFGGKVKYLSLYEFFPARFIGRIELREKA